jgi:hypothetical protein
MEEVADGTRVKVETDMRVTGPAAQFGRGVMQDVSAKLMRQFAECLASEMSAAPAETNGVVPIPEPEPVAAAAPSNGGTPPPAPEPEAPQPERRAPEVLDLGEASRDALLKRAIPLVGGVIALLIVIRLIRRR